MKLSSRDAIIKKQAVTHGDNPRRLTTYSDGGIAGGPQAGAIPMGPDTADTAESSGLTGPFVVTESLSQGNGETFPSPLSQEVDDILCAARQEEENILREAHNQAASIVSEARLQAKSLRQEIRESLLQEELPQALEEGRENGRQEGIQAGRQEVDDIVKKVQDFYQMLEGAWHKELTRIDQDLLELALKISERMVGTVLKYDKDKLLSMIRSLILLPNERRNLKIMVSDADWDWLKSLQDGDLPPYPLVRDEGLQPGNVLIQSNEGIFDAQLETQLDKFREVLSEELINGQLESFS